MPVKTFSFLIDSAQLTNANPDLDLMNSENAEFLEAVNKIVAPWMHQCCCSSSNWLSSHKQLLMRNGRVIQLVDDNDWRGRAEDVKAWSEDIGSRTAVCSLITAPNEFDLWLRKIIFHALRISAECAFRHDENGTIGERTLEEILNSNMSIDEILAWFYYDLPNEISRMYFDVAEDPNDVPDKEDLRKKRISLALLFEAFSKSVLPPFTAFRCKAEQYRCFDFRADPRAEINLKRVAFIHSDFHL